MSIVSGIIASAVSVLNVPEPGSSVASLPTTQNSLRRAYYSGYHNEDPLYTLDKVPSNVTYTSTIQITESGDDFTVEWTGWFYPPVTDNYRFSIGSDDGSYLWIGTPALTPELANTNVSNGGPHGQSYVSGSKVRLIAGKFYPIRLLFGEIGGDQNMDAYFIRDNNGTQVSLSSYVYTEVPETQIVANSTVFLDATTYGGSGNWINLGTNTSANADITTVTAAPTWSNNFGGMFSFYNVSRQYAQLPNLGTLNNFTVSGWMRQSGQVSGGACLITEGYVGTDLNFSIGHLPGYPGDYGMSAGVFDQQNATWYYASGSVPDVNKWYHYTLTFNGSNILFYVNGRLVNTALFNGIAITSSGEPIYIGRRWDNFSTSDSYIWGDISVINIYNSCLSPNEVAQNFNYHKYRYGLNYSLTN